MRMRDLDLCPSKSYQLALQYHVHKNGMDRQSNNITPLPIAVPGTEKKKSNYSFDDFFFTSELNLLVLIQDFIHVTVSDAAFATKSRRHQKFMKSPTWIYKSESDVNPFIHSAALF